jgi:RHS repeat-associated protein
MKINKTTLFGNFFAIAWTIALAVGVCGQTPNPLNPSRGTANGASFSLSDIENINLTNGNLMLNMPLVTLPPSRGGLQASLGLMYNSKNFDSMTQEVPDYSNQLADQNLLAHSYAGGWKMTNSIKYSLKVTNRFWVYPQFPCEEGQEIYAKNSYKWKVQVEFPDGSEKEFQPLVGTDPNDEHFYNVSPNGYRIDYDAGNQCSSNGYFQTTDPMVYKSTDGSYLRLIIEHDTDSDDTNNAFSLYFPDGGHYQSSNGRVTDRNGNYLEPTTFTYGGKTASGITDQTGHKIFSTSGDQSNEVFFYQLGVGGAAVKWTVRFKNIYVRRDYETTPNSGLREKGGTSTQVWSDTLNVVNQIVQPSQLGGQTYEFTYYGSDLLLGTGQYSTGWGEISSITLPTDAVASYTYYTDEENTDGILSRSVSGKTLAYHATYDGSSTAVSEHWDYSISPVGSSVTGPDGSVTTQTHGSTLYQSAHSGLVKSIEYPNGTRVEKIWNIPDAWNTQAFNPYVKMEFTSVKSGSTYTLTSIKEFAQDRNGNQTSVKEYGFVNYGDVPRTGGAPTGLPSGIGNPIRSTITTYYNATPDASDTTTVSTYDYWKYSPVRNVVKSVEVRNSSNQVVSKSEVDYDDYSSTANPTATRTWDSTKGAVSSPLTTGTSGNSMVTSFTYNSYGMPLTTTDANGIVTQVTYGNVAGPSGNVTDVYPTQTVTAYGTSQARTSSAVYDFYTGLVTSATDVDNSVTNSMEYDDLGRPTKAITADGTALESWTTTEYHDEDRFVVVKSDLETVGDGKRQATQFYDQLGRVRLSKTLEDASTQSATNETDGIKVETRYKTDYNSGTGVGHTYQLTSNPFRASTSSAATSEETMGWTLSTTLNTGRHSEVQTFAGAGLPTAFGGSNTTSTGIVQTDSDANATTVTDQAGKLRRSITNGLGQITRVDEPNSSNQLGTVSSPNQATNYYYDTLGKMVRVEQGSQNRYFMYGSLGRMIRLRQPEQQVNTALNTSGNPDNNNWTLGVTYDANGNVLTTTDAKGVTITSTYDALNRQITRSYSDSTPSVTFEYDASTASHSKGRLTKVSSSISETSYTGFDENGNLLSSMQKTDNVSYPSSYKYNLSGSLTEQVYPSGRLVRSFVNSSGDITTVSSRTAVPWMTPYVTDISYNATHLIKALRLGNHLWESAVINSRNQVEQLKVGTSATDGSLLNLSYEYGELQTNGTVDTTKNTGNVAKQTINFSGLANPFVQAYKYDSLDRITEAKETVNGSQTWIQQFGYDRYGNRTSLSQTLNGQSLAMTSTTLPAVDASTNRFDDENYEYDAAGNLIRDAMGRQFIFNGDNKQTKVQDSQDNTIGEYSYDGNGKRVKKITDTETTIFVYDGLGKLIGEYSTASASSPTISYTATDSIGSPRVITDQQGQVVSRRDFMPFGEELPSESTYRTGARKYGQVDGVRQKFTGYQRDNETGIDFAEARYYYNNHGRFTAVDPLTASGKSSDPQTFNRYVYVLNNPERLKDPTGLQAGEGGESAPDYVVQTNVCGTFNIFCKIKEGAKQFFRSLIGQGGLNDTEEEQFRERKRTGPDKVVANAIRNELDGLNTATNAAVEADPTGVLDATKTVVNNSLGRASDDEVYRSMIGAALNTAATLYTPSKGVTVLGKFPHYLKFAEKIGASRFNIPKRIWEGMTEAERWAANTKFLDRAIARGDDIVLSSKVKDLSKVSGSLRKEIDYLIEKGYELSEDGRRMIR